MKTAYYLASFVILQVSLGTIKGSTISFTADPPTLQTPLTQHLSLKCGFNEDDGTLSSTSTPTTTTITTTGGGLVGKRSQLEQQQEQQSIQESDKSYTSRASAAESAEATADAAAAESEAGVDLASSSKRSADKVAHVTSMTISQFPNQQPIASITTFTPAQLQSGLDLGNVSVTGDLVSDSNTVAAGAKLGFLQMDWTAPSPSQAGGYQCDVTAITESGHVLRLSVPLDIKNSAISINDLAKAMGAMTATIDDLKDTVKDYQTQLTSLTSQLASHTLQLSAANSNISALQKDLDEARHVETGVLDCGSMESWVSDGGFPGGHHAKHKYVSRQFSKPYAAPPVVFLSLRYEYMPHGEIFGFVVTNVTSSGFEMACETSGGNNKGSGYEINDLEVSWLSVAAD